MINDHKLEIEDAERGGISLLYSNNNHHYGITIYVDEINCVSILIGGLYDSKLHFTIARNDGYSAEMYLNYIKNNLDANRLPKGNFIEIYQELLDNEALRDCLDRCLKNIPENIYLEEGKQIAKAREKYEKTVKEVLSKSLADYELAVRCIVSLARNAEKVRLFSSLENYGLIDNNLLDNDRKHQK